MRIEADNRHSDPTIASWAKLVAGAMLLAGTFLMLAQGYAPPGWLGAVVRNNLHQGIDATALFYTRSEALSEAETLFHHAVWPSADRADGHDAPRAKESTNTPGKGALLEGDGPELD